MPEQHCPLLREPVFTDSGPFISRLRAKLSSRQALGGRYHSSGKIVLVFGDFNNSDEFRLVACDFGALNSEVCLNIKIPGLVLTE